MIKKNKKLNSVKYTDEIQRGCFDTYSNPAHTQNNVYEARGYYSECCKTLQDNQKQLSVIDKIITELYCEMTAPGNLSSMTVKHMLDIHNHTSVSLKHLLHTVKSFPVNIFHPCVTQRLPPMSQSSPSTGTDQLPVSISGMSVYNREMLDTVRGYQVGIIVPVMRQGKYAMSHWDMFMGNSGFTVGNSGFTVGNSGFTMGNSGFTVGNRRAT